MNSQYFIPSDDRHIIHQSSTVVLQDLIQFKNGGEVVGTLDATIDFKDLSPEFHQDAIQLLMRMPVSLHLPSEQSNKQFPESVREDKQVESVWQKIKKIFGG